MRSQLTLPRETAPNPWAGHLRTLPGIFGLAGSYPFYNILPSLSDYNLSREDMDDFAARSFQRAEHSEKAGYFAREIVPFTAFKKDPVTGQRTKVVITKDEGIRYGTTKASLLKIRGAFPQWGKGLTTGGNASQISDGAAAVLLMTRRKADELGLKILGRHVSTAVAGEYGPVSWQRCTKHADRCAPPHHGCRPCLCNPDGLTEQWYYTR